MQKLLAVLRTEPASVIAVLRASLYALALFGFQLDEAQIIALVAVAETFSALLIRMQTVTKPFLRDVLKDAGGDDDQVTKAVEEATKQAA